MSQRNNSIPLVTLAPPSCGNDEIQISPHAQRQDSEETENNENINADSRDIQYLDRCEEHVGNEMNQPITDRAEDVPVHANADTHPVTESGILIEGNETTRQVLDEILLNGGKEKYDMPIQPEDAKSSFDERVQFSMSNYLKEFAEDYDRGNSGNVIPKGNLYESRPSNLYHLIENVYVQHDTTVQRLVFIENELHQMCKEKLEESVIPRENRTSVILFDKLQGKIKVLGLFGNAAQLIKFISKANVLPQDFTDTLIKDPTALPFGVYAVTVDKEITWMFLWSPRPEQIEKSILVTSQRILQELCEKLIWFMDISEDDINNFIQVKDDDEDYSANNIMSVDDWLIEEQMTIAEFKFTSDQKSEEKPKNAITFCSTWIVEEELTGEQKTVTKDVVISHTVAELVHGLKGSNLVFDWDPNNFDSSPYKLTDAFDNDPLTKKELEIAYQILGVSCPALEEFYLKSSLHVRFSNKFQGRKVPFCTWCCEEWDYKHKRKCQECGAVLVYLDRNEILCYLRGLDELKTDIQRRQAQSRMNIECSITGEILNDMIERMKYIEHRAREYSDSCDLAEDFENKIKKSVLAFTNELPTLSCIARAGRRNPKQAERNIPDAKTDSTATRVLRTAKGVYVNIRNSHIDAGECGSESEFRTQFYDESICYFSSFLFQEYSRLRENFCVMYALNNENLTNSNSSRIRVFDILESDGKITMDGKISYIKDKKISHQGHDTSLVFHNTLPHISFNSSVEKIKTCFVGKSDALVIFTEEKLSRNVELSIAVTDTHVASLPVNKMPDITTYLDGTSQLVGAVYKTKDANGVVDWTQQKVIVYSYICNTRQFEQFDLALHGANKKWAVGDIIQMQFIPSAQKLTALDRNQIFHIWDWQTLQLEWQVKMDYEFDTYRFSPDGECLFFFEKTNNQNINVNLAKFDLLKGLTKLSDIYKNFGNGHVLHFLHPLEEDYSVDITALSSSEIVTSVYSGGNVSRRSAYLLMDSKKLRYVKKDPSENAEICVNKIAIKAEQYADTFTKFATSLSFHFSLADTMLLPLPSTVSDNQQSRIRDGIERIIHKRVAEEGKNIAVLPTLKVLKECDAMKSIYTLSKCTVEGEWIRRLILLLPVQIVRAQARRLYPVVNGITLNTTLMDFGKNEEAVTKLGNEITFGPLTSVILAHDQNVKIVASVGRTSTGKSFLLNHLTGTLFYVDPGRCTEGIWISAREATCKCKRCEGNRALYVSIDVEGLSSLTRSEQEDALLAQFTFAISSLVILNQREKVMDRGLKDMLIKLTSGMKVTKSGDVQNFVHGDENLFKSTFIIALKDIADHERRSILRQMAVEVYGCKAGSAELQTLFQKSPKSVALPYQQRPEYYQTITNSLFPLLRDETECCFGSGCEFYLKCITILSSLVLSSSQPLRNEYQESAIIFIKKHINDAEKQGNMKLRNPRFSVPDYPGNKLCILPLISHVRIMSKQEKIPTDGYHNICEFGNHRLFVNVSTVPDDQVNNFNITKTGNVLDVNMERTIGEKGIRDIKILGGATALELNGDDVIQIPGVVEYSLKIDRPQNGDIQQQTFHLKDSCIIIDDTSEERIRSFMERMTKMLQNVFPRDGCDEEAWFQMMKHLILAIIERRQWRLMLWPKQLAEEIGLQSEWLIDTIKFEKRVGKLDALKQLCGNRCRQMGCHFKCLLPHNTSIVKQCDCLNENHHCTWKCSWECKDSNGMPQLCSLGAGHHTVNGTRDKKGDTYHHKCDSQDHYCQVLCSVSNCLNPCKNIDGHEKDHRCRESHPCHNRCSAPFCATPCKFQVDEPHEFCICSQEYCTCPCQIPGCKEQCQVKDHFHSASETRVYHFCSHRHECYIACSHPGVCEVLQIRDLLKLHFKVGRGVTEKHKVTIQKVQKHQCSKSIPEMEVDTSLPNHSESHICNMSHQCTTRCPMCLYLCQESVTIHGKHPEMKHNTHHGEMIGAYHVFSDIHSHSWECKDSDGRIIESSDIAFNRRCNMYCLDFPDRGRGHTHLCHEKSNLNSSTQIATKMHYHPDDKQVKKLVSHPQFWDSINFEDPYANKDVDQFLLCNYHCRICESFCGGTLNHEPFIPTLDSGGGGHITRNGHHFTCKHPTHFVMVFDRSGSMSGTDIVPESVSPLKNRLGTVLESSLLILQALSKADSKVSLILFNDVAESSFVRETTDTAVNYLQSILKSGKVTPVGRTSFGEALSQSHRLLDENEGTNEYVVMLFLSDGQCDVDLGLIDRIKQLAYLKLTFYAIHCAKSSVGRSLTRMVDRCGNNSRAFHCTDREEMRRHFGTVADRINQMYHIIPKVHGFDPKINMLEKIQHSELSKEEYELINSHQFNDVRNMFLRKTHPDGVYDECHGRKILLFGNDKGMVDSLITAAIRVNKMDLVQVEVDSEDAASRLYAIELSSPCLVLLTKLNDITNTVITSLQYLSLQLNHSLKSRAILVGIITDVDQLQTSITNLFDVNIHIPLPCREERLNLIKDLAHLGDGIAINLSSVTDGLTFQQIKDVVQEINENESEMKETIDKVMKLSQRGREIYNMTENFLLVANKFCKTELHLEDRIAGDHNLLKEALKRLANDDIIPTLVGIIDEVLNQRSFDKLCIILDGLDGSESKQIAKIIARFLNRQLIEFKYIDSVGKLVADTTNKPQDKGIAYSEDLSLLRSLLTCSFQCNIVIAHKVKDSILELENLSGIDYKIIEFESPKLQTRRLYLSDYIHEAFKPNELFLNKEQDLYWLAYNTSNARHKDLKDIIKLAFSISCHDIKDTEYYQPLLFEKAEEPDFVCCKALDYGAHPVETLPIGAKLKPPPLNIHHLAAALVENRGIAIPNGKILSQLDLFCNCVDASAEGCVLGAENLNAKVFVVPHSVPNGELLKMTLIRVSSECFFPTLKEEVDWKEIIASHVIHVGPPGCKFDVSIALNLPFITTSEYSYDILKLMYSPTAYGRPTSWQCVLETDQSMESVTIKNEDNISLSKESGTIKTTTLGLWAWVGRIPLQTITMMAEIYRKCPCPIEEKGIYTIRLILSTIEQGSGENENQQTDTNDPVLVGKPEEGPIGHFSFKASSREILNIEVNIKTAGWSQELCTFTFTNGNFVEQDWYHCETCNLTKKSGCCTACTFRCHKGHKISYSKYGPFFCDCGNNVTKCKALTKSDAGSEQTLTQSADKSIEKERCVPVSDFMEGKRSSFTVPMTFVRNNDRKLACDIIVYTAKRKCYVYHYTDDDGI